VLPGIVLAAGDSVRMGSPKALLSAVDGRVFVARIVQTLRSAGCTDVVVVTGRHHDAIAAALDLQDQPTAVVRNPDPSQGQLSSLWIGMDAVVTSTTDALLVTLVDVPMIAVATVTVVIDAWRRTRAPIVRPAIGERHGHPVIFDRALFQELRAAPLNAGAKSVVRAHEHEIVNVTVDDEGCLTDVDTPDDYRRLLGS
jgi:molybdenum cofactor cytidylyltransferase